MAKQPIAFASGNDAYYFVGFRFSLEGVAANSWLYLFGGQLDRNPANGFAAFPWFDVGIRSEYVIEPRL